jgi:DNA primase large subunit
MADLAFCAHYPFSASAKEHVASRKLEFTSSLLEKAEDRLRDAVKDGKIRKVPKLEDAQEEELALYAICRMIASAAANRYLINRYAVAEAKKTSDYLSGEDKSREDYLVQVASEFGITFEKDGIRFLVPLEKYLAFTPRSVDYKLSNRQVKNGKVSVSSHERVRMVEEAVKKKMESELPIRAAFPPEVKDAAARLLALLPKLEIAIVRVGQENYPPCIRKLLEELSMNVNLPHTARVALGIYLIRAGMPVEKIVELFRSAPDFSEKTTRYQVEYLKQKNYSMPSCATMDSYGACVAECRCGTPLNFRANIHGRRLEREAEGMKK